MTTKEAPPAKGTAPMSVPSFPVPIAGEPFFGTT